MMISSNMGTAQLRDSTVYTDLNGLNSIRQLGQDDRPEALRQIAIQFESIFLNMMLKEMRKGEETLFTDNYLRTNEMAFHRDNLDNQLGLHLASHGGVGLADALHDQMVRHQQSSSAATSVTPAPNKVTRQAGLTAYRDAERLFTAPVAEPVSRAGPSASETL